MKRTVLCSTIFKKMFCTDDDKIFTKKKNANKDQSVSTYSRTRVSVGHVPLFPLYSESSLSLHVHQSDSSSWSGSSKIWPSSLNPIDVPATMSNAIPVNFYEGLTTVLGLDKAGITKVCGREWVNLWLKRWLVCARILSSSRVLVPVCSTIWVEIQIITLRGTVICLHSPSMTWWIKEMSLSPFLIFSLKAGNVGCVKEELSLLSTTNVGCVKE